MQVCGIICEYNPFHNGHAYQLQKAREQADCAYAVCVMSGHFTQRGGPALLSKWARAEMALRAGADAVFELPALFAVRDAEHFALGGVSLLTGLGAVTHLCFGSETGALEPLRRMASAEPDAQALRENLDAGMTLARARGEALGDVAGRPNDILGAEYLRAIVRLGSPLIPIAIRREGGGYHDPRMRPMASATAIRAALLRGEDVYEALPAPAYALMNRLLAAGAYQAEGGLDTALLALLRTMPPETLARAVEVSEGLENRILRAAQDAATRAQLLAAVKCKRYTYSRISRVLTQAFLGITKRLALEIRYPPYARLLGFRRDAQPLLSAIKRESALPIVTRPAKYAGPGAPALALDIRAGDLWSLGLREKALRTGRGDLTQGVVIVE